MTTTAEFREDLDSGIRMTGQTIMYRAMYPEREYLTPIPEHGNRSMSETISNAIVSVSIVLAFAGVATILATALRT